MDRNTTIAFILIGAILVVWLFINTPEQKEQTRKEQDTKTTLEKKAEEFPEIVLEEKTASDPKTGQNVEDTQGIFSIAETDSGRIVTIETDLAIYELSTMGGNFHKVFLKKFNNWYSIGVNGIHYNTSVQLLNYSIGNAHNISFISAEGKAINTGRLDFKTADQSRYYLTDQDTLSIKFRMELDQNRAIEKEYLFNAESYLIKSDIKLIGLRGLITDNTYDIACESGIRFVERNSVNAAGFSSADI